MSLKRGSLLLPALLVVMTACGFGGRLGSGVGVEKDRTDIVYGFQNPAQPAPAAPAGPQPEAAPPGLPEIFRGNPVFRFFSSKQAAGACPAAPGNAAVSEQSPTEVAGKPKPGTYRWVGSGTFDLSGTKVPLPNFFPYYVTPSKDFNDNVPAPPGSVPSENFTYQTIEPRYSFNNAVYNKFYWQVKTNSPVSQDPEGGLVLTRIDLLDGAAKPIGGPYFNALESGLLVVPLPIRAGGTWKSASLDPSSGRNLTIDGEVTKREVTDACGTLIQGWQVKATFSEGPSGATLEYLIGTQYGGQIISRKIEGSFLGTSFNAGLVHTGQLNPEALPDKFNQ